MTYKAGVIGFGRVGRNHAEAFIETPEIELTAIADIDEELVAELGDVWEIPNEHRYHHHTEMLASESLDVVSVATPELFHHENVLEVVNSDPNVDVIWCEKPIATSVSDADAMVAACDEAGIELVVNHTRRFAKAHKTLQELIHEREFLGEIKSVHLVARGTFLNIGTHYIDLLLYLLDKEVTRVHGGQTKQHEYDNQTRYSGGGSLSMKNGPIISFELAGTAAPNRTYVYGDEGGVSFPLGMGENDNLGWEYWKIKDGNWAQSGLPEPLDELWADDISGTHSTYEPGMVPAQNSFEQAAVQIVDLLDGRISNPSPGKEAVHGLEILIACYLSDKTNSEINLPLDRPLREVCWTR